MTAEAQNYFFANFKNGSFFHALKPRYFLKFFFLPKCKYATLKYAQEQTKLNHKKNPTFKIRRSMKKIKKKYFFFHFCELSKKISNPQILANFQPIVENRIFSESTAQDL